MDSGSEFAGNGGECTNNERSRSSFLKLTAITFTIWCPLRATAGDLPVITTLQCNGVSGSHHRTPRTIPTTARFPCHTSLSAGSRPVAARLVGAPLYRDSHQPPTSTCRKIRNFIAASRRLPTLPGPRNTLAATGLTAGRGRRAGRAGSSQWPGSVYTRGPRAAWWPRCSVETAPTVTRVMAETTYSLQAK